MQPYNECENNWLSRTKQKIVKHYREHETLYAALAGLMLVALLVLAMITSIDSFFEIGN